MSNSFSPEPIDAQANPLRVLGLKGEFASYEMYLNHTHRARTLRTLLF